MTALTPEKGRPQGGMKSEMGKSAYWRMQWESAIGALADLIAEHTETVEQADRITAALRDPSDEMVNVVVGAVWDTPYPVEMYPALCHKARAAIAALADSLLGRQSNG